ncbi:MAG TPA: GNAT family N-acetyltransferase [Verrucomicrobiae bacterium]|nr:GNAT family N-acetyltransferase [Verrucomicrobiae bacterium]
MTADVRLEPAAPADLPAIAECVRLFRLDDEDLAPEQFVVARERGRLVAFGRIKPYGRVWELGSVGVLEAERGRGLGALVVRELIRRFPARHVYITTDLPAYFARFGFRRIDDPPPEIAAKIGRVCARLRSGVVAMVLEKPTPRSSP